ncbi:MAG: ABC transporter permease subunit [Gemmataceae bacterium]
MKLVALLKDSCREAIDRKIFAAMLVLSGLVTLFVASISFRQISLEDELKSTTGQISYFMRMDPNLGKPTFAIENFRQTNDAAEPWKGDYSFDWVITVNDADKLKRVPLATRYQVKKMIRDGMNYLNSVEVSENSSKEPTEARFTVTTRGTKVPDRLAWRHEPSVLFAVPVPFIHTSLREGVYFIEDTLVGGLGAWVAVLVGVICTASFIPNMLQKGSVDLILAKPVRRVGLLIYKYIGGLIFVLLLTAASVLGVWTAIGLRTGVWSPEFLLIIPAVTFYFALLYAVSTLAAVLTRSAVVAILMTCAVWFGLWLNGTVHNFLDGVRKAKTEVESQLRKQAGLPKADEKAKDPEEKAVEEEERQSGRSRLDVPPWVYATSDFLYKALPRTGDLNKLTTHWIARGVLTEAEIKERKLDQAEKPLWGEAFGVTGAFIAVMLGLACWRFVRADY